MKRLALFLVMLFCAAVFAQGGGAPKIAVYVTGELNANEKQVLGTEILTALVKSGRYAVVERSAEFAAALGQEYAAQRSGILEDGQISRLGRQFGTQYICVVGVAIVADTHHVAARLIDIETAETRLIGRGIGLLNCMEAFVAISEIVVNNMFRLSNQVRIEPVKARTPVRVAAPPAAPAPVVAAAPPAAPAPVVAAAPPVAPAPVVAAAPAVAAEPVKTAEPAKAAEPVVATEPVVTAEPVVATEPVVVAEPVAAEEPARTPESGKLATVVESPAEARSKSSAFMSAGMIGFFGTDFGGGGFGYESKEHKISMSAPWVGGGVGGFLDLAYVEIGAGLTFTSGKLKFEYEEYSYVTKSKSEESLSIMYLNLGLLLKIPISLNDNVSIWPAAGIDYAFCVSAMYGGKSLFRYNDKYNESDMSQLWLKFGLGMDFNISDAMFLRTKLLYGAGLASKISSDGVEFENEEMRDEGMKDDFKVPLSHGLHLGVGLGFKF